MELIGKIVLGSCRRGKKEFSGVMDKGSQEAVEGGNDRIMKR